MEDQWISYTIYSESLLAKMPQLKAFLEHRVSSYIWHKDPFKLEVSDAAPMHASGRVSIGDCIEDEWFIASLLMEISEQILPDTVISVQDVDGEFLLIEAALDLPKWIKPESVENRVFIHRGDLCVIPVEVQAHGVADAVKVVRQTHPALSLAVQQKIRDRIKSHSSNLQDHQHLYSSRCILPRDIARVLVEQPQWIAKAVEAFYTRDMLSLRLCQKMTTFPPSAAVVSRVKFSKQLYAQLASQTQHPPKPFMDVAQLRKFLSPTTDTQRRKPQQCKWADIGMKIACGFEILMNDSLYAGRPLVSSSDTVESYDFGQDFKWKSYLRNLNRKNFFQNELEGSELYQHLMSKVKTAYFTALLDRVKSSDDKNNLNDEKSLVFPQTWSTIVRLNPSVSIPALLKQSRQRFSTDEDFDKYLESSGHWRELVEDDSWMYVSPEELQESLDSRNRTSKSKNASPEKVVDEMVKGVHSLMSSKSDLEGIQKDVENEDENGESFSDSSASDDDDMTPKQMQAEFKQYFEKMETELSGSLARGTLDSDVDVNMADNFLRSFAGQNGMSGPVSTLLGLLGIQLPADADAVDK